VKQGIVDVMIAGGAEAPLFPFLFGAFDRLGMMSAAFNADPQRASRPFSADRDGFVLGEGAGMLVIESEEHRSERSAPRLAEVCGYAATCDAHSHFFQDEKGVDASRAILHALAEADAFDDIKYVNAHGTATRKNDPIETQVIKQALGARAYELPISSTKSMIGHSLGASAALELIATIVAMRDGFAPPTINLANPDNECDLDYVPNRARACAIDAALSTSFGFGSRNAAVVVRR
jgi:3-oxoacyl-[acyl-carrier-protein] synthase II